MGWSSDGVQTGTDADISGIGNVDGVTLHTIGSGANVRRVAEVTVNLTINGTLTIDPEHEELILSGDIGIVVNGSLTIGRKITINGSDRYSFGTAIHHAQSAVWYDEPYLLEVTETGAFDWFGGVIYTGGKSIRYKKDSNVTVHSSNAVLIRTADPQRSQAQIRMETDNYTQHGLTDVGFNNTQDWFTFIGKWESFGGYKPIHKRSALCPSSISDTSLYLVEDYEAIGCTYDDLFWKKKRLRFKNSGVGSALNLVGAVRNNYNNQGVVEVTSDFTLKVIDQWQSPISGCVAYLRDYDNGDRKNDNITPARTNYIDDREYVCKTDAHGSATIEDILTMAVVRNSGKDIGEPDSGNNKYDYRSKNNDNSDVFDIGIYAYGYLKVVASNVPLIGKGGVGYKAMLFADQSITNQDIDAVSAYTNISTLSELYDYGAYWHISDDSGRNIATPSLGDMLLTGGGGAVSTGGYNITIRKGAGEVLSVSGAEISVNSSGILTGSDKFSTLQAGGTATFDGVDIGVNIVGDTYYLNNAGDITGVVIDGDLHIDIGEDASMTFSDVTVTGKVYNDSGNTLSITTINGTSIVADDEGAGSGQINIINNMAIVLNNIQAGSAVYIQDNNGTAFDYKVFVEAQDYTALIPKSYDGEEFVVVVNKAGYEPQISTITIVQGGEYSINIDLRKQKNADGTDMYAGGSSQYCDVEFAGGQATIAIGDGQVPLQAAYDEVEAALQTENGMAWIADGKSGCSIFNSASGDYLFMSSGWRLKRRSPSDVNATLQAFAVSEDNHPVDGENGGILFLTSDTPQQIAKAVMEYEVQCDDTL